jgi:hypothetical protein
MRQVVEKKGAAQQPLQVTPLRGLISGHDLVMQRVFSSEARRVSRAAPELFRWAAINEEDYH